MPDRPEAASSRIPWDALPARVRARIAARAGSDVHAVAPASGGFSAGFAGVVEFADGSRSFVKAGDGATNAETARLHRRESHTAARLPEGLAARLHWEFDDGDWVVIAFEVIDGAHPGSPWTLTDLSAVLEAQARVGRSPAPTELPDLAESLPEMLTGWSLLAAHDPAGVDAALERHLDLLVQWEGMPVREAAHGDGIVHLDLRSDNVLLTPGGARFVDWPHAGRGAAWLDLVFFAPTVGLESGPSAAEVVAASPLADEIDPDALVVLVSGWAGRLRWMSRQPAPPGIPHLRAFQAAQADVVQTWLLDLLRDRSVRITP